MDAVWLYNNKFTEMVPLQSPPSETMCWNWKSTFLPKLCSGCFTAYYCSKKCIKNDWDQSHKNHCEELRIKKKESKHTLSPPDRKSASSECSISPNWWIYVNRGCQRKNKNSEIEDLKRKLFGVQKQKAGITSSLSKL